MVELTLGCIHYVLIERGYLQGKSSIGDDGLLLEALGEGERGRERSLPTKSRFNLIVPPRLLIDHIIETVCRCSKSNDDNVHLQAIKVLLTAILKILKCAQGNVTLAIQACFHIHLVSKNPVNGSHR